MFEGLSRFRDITHIPRSKRYAYKSADATLEIFEQVVEVDSSDGAVTITLPSVEEAAGMAYDISAPNGVTNTVTVNDAGGTNMTTTVGANALDADGDFMTVMSTGKAWRLIDNSAA